MRAAVLMLFLCGCPTVDTGETPVTPPLCQPDPARFKDIWNLAVAPSDASKSCVGQSGCHAQATGRSALRLIEMPVSDEDWAQNYAVISRFLDCAAPSESPFITKPEAGTDPHLGGDLWDCTGSCEPIRTIEAWIAGR